jgi:hypothetical protein
MAGGPYLWFLKPTADHGDVPVYDSVEGRFKPGSAASSRYKVAAITSAESPVTVDDTVDIYLIDASGGPVAVNLPAVSSFVGRVWQFVKVDATVNLVTLTPNGADTIGGEATREIAFQHTNVPILGFSNNWTVL